MGKDFIIKTLQKNHFVSEGLANCILAFLKIIFNDFFSGFTKMKEDEMVVWHHQLNEHEFEQAS